MCSNSFSIQLLLHITRENIKNTNKTCPLTLLRTMNLKLLPIEIRRDRYPKIDKLIVISYFYIIRKFETDLHVNFCFRQKRLNIIRFV